ncbi:MAG: hypothetical protein CME13_21685 [Gemmatimonadetes bacterium]|nr:hypothetical protein [Gemmatimonadota bacterium]
MRFAARGDRCGRDVNHAATVVPHGAVTSLARKLINLWAVRGQTDVSPQGAQCREEEEGRCPLSHTIEAPTSRWSERRQISPTASTTEQCDIVHLVGRGSDQDR